MTHGEKMARAALKRWLDFYSKRNNCDCIEPHEIHCHRHRSEVVKLIKDTKMLLATGPN